MGNKGPFVIDELSNLRAENESLRAQVREFHHEKIMADEAARLAAIEAEKAEAVRLERVAKAGELEERRVRAWKTAHTDRGAAIWASGDTDAITHFTLEGEPQVPADGWPEGISPVDGDSYETDVPLEPEVETDLQKAIRRAAGVTL